MDKNTALRTNFANGIISHSVGVRTDWNKQVSSVKEALNFVVTPSGAMRKRPGLQFLDYAMEVVHNGKLVPPRILKFEFALGQTYMLEFGHYRMRFWLDDALIRNPNGTIYEISTPYSYAQVLEFSWAQYKDVLFFTQWDQPIQNLVRGPSATHTNWYWTSLVIGPDNLLPAPKNVRFAHDGHNGVAYTVTTIKDGQESKGGNEIITTPIPVAPEQPPEWPVWSDDPFQCYVNLMAWMERYQGVWGPKWGLPAIPQDVIDVSKVPMDWDYGQGIGFNTPLNTYHLDNRLNTLWRRIYGFGLQFIIVYATHYSSSNPNNWYASANFMYVNEGYSLQSARQDYKIWDFLFATHMLPLYNYTFNQAGVVTTGPNWGYDAGEIAQMPPGMTTSLPNITNNNKMLWASAADTVPNAHSYMIRNHLVNLFNAGAVVGGVTLASLYNQIMSHKYTPPTVTANNVIAWDPVPGATSYRIYRRTLSSTNPLFYMMQVGGTVPASQLTFTDTDVSTTITNASYSPPTTAQYFDTPDTYPNTCTFYQQRLVVGSTKRDPLMIGGSVPGVFNDFSESDNPLDTTGAWRFRLASKTSNPIRHLIPLRSLYVLTQAGAFVSTVTGSVNRSNVNFNQEAFLGASGVVPVIIERTALYVPLNSQSINSLQYSFADDAFVDDNVIFAAQDLLEDQVVTSMDFLRPTVSLLCATTSSGKLLLCTYIPRQQFAAWTHMQTDGDVAQCCANTTADGLDELYCVVKRFGRYNMEKLGDMRVLYEEPTMANGVYLDASLSGAFASPMSVITGLGHLEGREVHALVDMSVQGPFTVEGGKITLDEPGREVQVGLSYSAVLETLDLQPVDVQTLIGSKRRVYRTHTVVEKSGDMEYQICDGETYEYIFQDETSLGFAPKIFTGAVDLPGAVMDTGSTRVRFVSRKPLPLTINAMTAEIVYAG